MGIGKPNRWTRIRRGKIRSVDGSYNEAGE
jgi:hypothetical protein